MFSVCVLDTKRQYFSANTFVVSKPYIAAQHMFHFVGEQKAKCHHCPFLKTQFLCTDQWTIRKMLTRSSFILHIQFQMKQFRFLQIGRCEWLDSNLSSCIAVTNKFVQTTFLVGSQKNNACLNWQMHWPAERLIAVKVADSK